MMSEEVKKATAGGDLFTLNGSASLGGGSKIVTFKEVRRRKTRHRRSKSLPTTQRNIDMPYSTPKLLREEVKELHKKKVILDTGVPEIKGWTTKKDKDKLKGAVATVLDEKRKEQLATIQKGALRAKELEAFLVAPPSLTDLQEKHVFVVVDEQDEKNTVEAKAAATPKIVRANVPIKQTREPPAPLRKHRSFGPSSSAKLGVIRPYNELEERRKSAGAPKLVRSRSSSSPEDHGIEPKNTSPGNNAANANVNGNDAVKSKTSWEKIFSKQKSGKRSPRETGFVETVPTVPKGEKKGGSAILANERISPRIKEQCERLEEWLKDRPTWGEVVEKKVYTKKERSNFRNSTEALELLMKERPSWRQVIERGIGKDEKEAQKKEKCKKKLRYFFRDRKQKQDTSGMDIYYELAVSAKRGRDGEPSSPPPEAAFPANPGEDDPSMLPETGEPTEINFFDIEFLGSIGGGCYGNVYEGYLKGDDKKVAVKILKNSLVDPEKSYRREVDALKRTIKSPYTVNLRGYCTDPYFCIVTDLCYAGSLETIMRKQGVSITTEQAVRIAKQVAEGMKYLHGLKPPILHRDISAGNIFLHPTVDGRACIGDFGIAITKARRGNIKYSQNGNPRYRAPEVSNGEPYSRKADVYSFGNLFYELLTNRKPFPEHEDNQVAAVIAKGGTPEFPAHCKIDPKLTKLVKKCWSKDPSDRPSFKKVVSQLEEFQNKQNERRKKEDNPGILSTMTGPPTTANGIPNNTNNSRNANPNALASANAIAAALLLAGKVEKV